MELGNGFARHEPSLGSAWYMVTICMVAYIFSFIDRQIVALLIEPIQADLKISDTQFSLIHGLAFSIFYAVMGLPIARLADTKSRPLIISIGIAIWSLATALCGTAKTFLHLFIARMAVGVGEAALSPATYSMISDAFPKSKLGLALAVYSIGSFMGAGLAYIIGGITIDLVENFGTIELPIIGILKPWQMTFFIVGLPGLVIAAVFFLTVKDPERQGATETKDGYDIKQVLSYIHSNKSAFLAHYFGFGIVSMALYALMSWAPAFFFRNYGLSTRDVGLSLGSLVLVCNVLGVLCGGWLTDIFTNQGRIDAPMLAGVIGAVGVLIPTALLPFMPNLTSTMVILGFGLFFASLPLAASAAALQIMAPNQMRAQVTAIFFLFTNLFGISGATMLVALATDYLFQNEKSVGFSMALIASTASIIGALVLANGLKHFKRTVESLDRTKHKC